MRLGCIICSNEPRLVLPACSLGLAEREAAIPTHALYSAYLLDRFLEPEMCLFRVKKIRI